MVRKGRPRNSQQGRLDRAWEEWVAKLSSAPGPFPWPVTCSLLAPCPLYLIPSPTKDKRRAVAGGFPWQTHPWGLQHLLESGRQEGSDRLAGKPH